MPHERILVAEDEADVRDLCMRALGRVGYQVQGAASGAQAVELARQQPFDLLLTDIKMPQMNGLEAYSAIREFNPDLAAVVMTGFGTLESAIEALRLGVSEFVLKPFRPDELNMTIARALSRRRIERENARLKALIPLFDLSRAFMSMADPEQLPGQVVRIAREEVRADSASLLALDDKGHATCLAAEGFAPSLPLKSSALGELALVRDISAQRNALISTNSSWDDDSAEHIYGSRQVTQAISIPIIHQHKLEGILSVARFHDPVPFHEADVELLSVLGSQIAVALDNARLFREIQTAYQRLAELDHLKSEFISIAAHELRSPLAVVLSYATLLEEEATGPMREHLGQVVQAAMQLKSIIDEMVSLRRIDTGTAQVTIEAVQVPTAVHEALKAHKLLADSKQQTILLDMTEDLPLVRADGQLLQLILGNLISNAIKFTPERGQITLSARGADGHVEISVHDTGVGIPADELERIFERFYQVEASLTRKHGGIGLGLAIAREMAEIIDGRIWAESTVGQGSTFFLSLPQA